MASPALAIAARSESKVPKATQPTSETAATPAAAAHAYAATPRSGFGCGASTVGSVASRAAKRVEILTKKPVMATEAEQFENPRSRSAKLRACRKLGQ